MALTYVMFPVAIRFDQRTAQTKSLETEPDR